VNTSLARWPKPEPRIVAGLAAILTIEALLLLAYLATASVTVTAPRYLLYPFVWINAGLLAIWMARPELAEWSRRRWVGVGIGLAYFLALAWIGGAIALGHAHGVRIHWELPPGWGPLVITGIGPFRIAPTPYRIFGYATLAYLVYVAAADADATPVSALVGAFSCVSCTLPVLAVVLSSAVGTAAGLGSVATISYDLSTLVYLSALGLLVWRPDAALLRRLR